MVDDLRAHLDALRAPRPGARWRRRTLDLLAAPGARDEVLRSLRHYASREAGAFATEADRAPAPGAGTAPEAATASWPAPMADAVADAGPEAGRRAGTGDTTDAEASPGTASEAGTVSDTEVGGAASEAGAVLDAGVGATASDAGVLDAGASMGTASGPGSGSSAGAVGLRGRVWAAALGADPAVIPLLAAVARRAAGADGGPADAPEAAAAVIGALGDWPDPAALDALAGLRRDVRHPALGRRAEAALAVLAERLGVPAERAAERGVPAHGLHADGSLARDLGGYQAVLAIADPATVRLTFTGADGRPLRTVPGALKRPFAGEIRELKALARRVRDTLTAERARVEALMSVEREWPYRAWCRHYRDHPVTGIVAQALIWEFESPDGGRDAATPGDGVLVTVDGRALPVPADEARVRLWHPVRARPGAVRAWRGFVTANRMRQAFRQAFRETYRRAEAADRFAARVVDRRRLGALLAEHGWTPAGAGRRGEARRVLAAGEWRACLPHEPVEGADLAVTGPVRFERRAGGAWLGAAPGTVPPLVFSEAMRATDLIVSAAADPEREHARDDRAASTEVRRDVLERVLPDTRFAGRCAVEGRFLVVRGELRTYRIDIGTAAVTMDPGGEPLPVAPSRRTGHAGLFLPVEDERLSRVLGAAALLAADTRITDTALRRRLAPGA